MKDDSSLSGLTLKDCWQQASGRPGELDRSIYWYRRLMFLAYMWVSVTSLGWIYDICRQRLGIPLDIDPLELLASFLPAFVFVFLAVRSRRKAMHRFELDLRVLREELSWRTGVLDIDPRLRGSLFRAADSVTIDQLVNLIRRDLTGRSKEYSIFETIETMDRILKPFGSGIGQLEELRVR
ncbi:MAG: hypothetical protein KGI45_03980 [Patescibacteria group bacterium]|nr:hypothetical protein [Patescibacteria group bacterium]MDE1967193.1 hypothetical protein [Patescibacteria group bacterium]